MRKMIRALSNRSKPAKRAPAPGDVRKNVFVWTIAGLLAILALSFVPTPFYIIAPGSAVDLSTRLSVEGRPPARRRFYLTDVAVARASLVLLAAGLWPGVRIVRRDTIVPQGESARGFDRLMVDAMGESQNAAAFVAERAAGYAVSAPPSSIEIRNILPVSHAASVLAVGDALVSVDRAPLRQVGDVRRILRTIPAETVVTVAYERSGRPMRAAIRTISGPGGSRLGVVLIARVAKPDLPVPVRYTMGDVRGSSGGLMFALEIYSTLRPNRAIDPVAGTGTIGIDGVVGPIEGVEQKLIAARRAGATTFLVPRENYATIANATGIRIVSVHTFREALAAIGG